MAERLQIRFTYNASEDRLLLCISELKIKKKSKGKYVLSLLNNENIGIHLIANMDLIHSLQKMLLDSASNAAWNRPVFQTADEKPEKFAPDGYLS